MANIKEKIEDKIIDCIALNAEGRLVVFKPENADKDLVVEKRSDYKQKKISLNIYSRKFADNRNFSDQISIAKGFIPSKDFYLVFVYFDLIKQKPDDNFWVIPSLDFAAAEKDFSKYLISQKEFVGFLLKELDK